MEMLPILKEADGILEGAIEFQRKLDARQKRKEARAAEREREAKESKATAQNDCAPTHPGGRVTLLRDRKTVEVELDPTGEGEP